jgi:hypothetical protein
MREKGVLSNESLIKKMKISGRTGRENSGESYASSSQIPQRRGLNQAKDNKGCLYNGQLTEINLTK